MPSINKWASFVKILLGAVFVFSAFSKLVTIDSFEMYIYSFGLFPLVLCFYFARLLIAAELLLGVALISHRYHRLTSITSLLFLLFFIAFLVYAHLIGRTDNCHCFGDLLPFNPVQSIFKNAILVLMLLFVYKYATHEWHPRWWLLIIIYLLVGAIFTFYSIKFLHALDYLSLVLFLVATAMGVLASLPFFSRWWITAPVIIAPFVTTFILSPPDSWFFHEGEVRYDADLFLAQLHEQDTDNAIDTTALISVADTTAVDTAAAIPVADTVGTLAELGLTQGPHLVAFFSPSCGYCRFTAEKISVIAKRKNVDPSRILYVFPDGIEQSKYDSFYERANSCRYLEARIDKVLFVRITRAAFPVVLLVDDGDIVASYGYRAINEKEISDFLSK